MKFEDVKESLREDVEAELIIQGVKAVRARLAEAALAQMQIRDPILKDEFAARLKSRDDLIRDREKIKRANGQASSCRHVATGRGESDLHADDNDGDRADYRANDHPGRHATAAGDKGHSA